MSSAQEQQLESLEEMLAEIRKDVEEATLIASKVSDKFNEVSKSIQDLSTTISKAFKDEGKAALAGAAVFATGLAVKLIGKAVSSINKEYELVKLLPKKQELARNKRDIIKNHLANLENREPKILILLEKELGREINLSDSEIQRKNSLSISFEIYTLSLHLKNVCYFLLAEFDAWDKCEHDSDQRSPFLNETLNLILKDIVLPDGVKSFSRINSGQAYLFKKYHSLLGSIFIKAFNEGFNIEKKTPNIKEKSMVKKPSFIFINVIFSELEVNYEKNNIHTNWIKSNYFYTEIKKVNRFYGKFLDLAIYTHIPYSILFLISYIFFANHYITDLAQIIVQLIIILPLLACIFYIVKTIRDWFEENSLLRILINIPLQFFSFGSVYYAEKRLAEKEYRYYAFFNQIKNLNKLV